MFYSGSFPQLYWGSPRPPSDLMISQKDSAYSCTHDFDLLQQNANTKQYQRREKAHGVKSGRDQAVPSQSPLLLGSHRMCLIPPASCDNMCEMLSPWEAHQQLSAQGFHWGLVMQTPSSRQPVPKFQTPRKEADVQHKPHC